MVGTSGGMKLVLVFILCVLTVMCMPSFLQPKISYGLGSGVKDGVYQSSKAIDLYTQKEPYGGRGANQPSDAFAPQEEVILYANVTYNGYPVANKLVTFEVRDPSLSSTLIRTALTNRSGLTNVSFRIPPTENAETTVFGTWSVLANVEITEEVVTDTLTFKVGWIVEILKVETVNVNNMSRTSFMRGEPMCFRLTVRNVAMTDKVATLTINAYDNRSVPLGPHMILEDELISPGITAYFIEDLLIPMNASFGVGVVHANAYTALPAKNGVPWCPEVSTTFLITKLIVHDVAVISVMPYPLEVFPCETVNITVNVRNEGDVIETFNVSVYYDSVLIGTLLVERLDPQAETTLIFAWSTCYVPVGNYTISAVASTVPRETDVNDNTFVNGTVRVKPPYVAPVVWELPAWLMWLLIILIILVATSMAISIALLFYVRKKKEISPEGENYKTCVKCGRSFLAVHAFCPHCFTYNG